LKGIDEEEVMKRKKVVIMGAAGRDFHNFNCVFRDNDEYEVVAFTATQIPWIAGRKYPASLAGKLYPDGIPIYDEEEIESLIRKFDVDEVVFAYSDVSHVYVMNRASIAIANGANFRLLGTKETWLKAKVPVVSVCAVRTGSGKSQTSRFIATRLMEKGYKVAVVRHPMPYGDLETQAVQRFKSLDDLEKHKCTVEEREEYEAHIEKGAVVYAGVDYHQILKACEKEADIIVWDGGNNDLPFFKPTIHIVVVDPLRAGHERLYHPGEANLRLADVAVINKVDSATAEQIGKVRNSILEINKKATIIEARSKIVSLEAHEEIAGKKVIVVEDGPTVTHGEMPYGAGAIYAERNGAVLVDPRPYAVGSIRETFEKYKHIGKVLPAMGYSQRQVEELRQTIEASDAQIVVVGTPIDLGRLLEVSKPMVRVRYEFDQASGRGLDEIVLEAVEKAGR